MIALFIDMTYNSWKVETAEIQRLKKIISELQSGKKVIYFFVNQYSRQKIDRWIAVATNSSHAT